MDDAGRFLSDCVTSGAVLRSICGLLVVPFAAWLAVRFLIPTLRRMHGDRAWQAPLAAAAVILPGLLLLMMAGTATVAGTFAVCTRTYTGRAVFGTFVLFTAALLVRAVLRVIGRVRETRALVAATVAPSPRVRALAGRCGIRVRELPDPRPFCALAGALHPVAVVSSGTAAQLGDGELYAALLHERAHAARGDQLLAAFAGFLADVLPLPAGDLMRLYRDAREYAADCYAVRTVPARDLAGALVACARGGRAFAHLASLPGEHGIAGRIRVLLDPSTVPRPSLAPRIVVVFALLTVFGCGLNPVRASLAASLRGGVPNVARTSGAPGAPAPDRCRKNDRTAAVARGVTS